MYGLEFATLDVNTADGYINTLWHVWSAKNLDKKLTPIFFMHGLCDSAGTWFFNEPEKAPAVILARQGYDIWLGNTRGGAFSLKHQKYTVEDRGFWQFSLDQLAKFD